MTRDQSTVRFEPRKDAGTRRMRRLRLTGKAPAVLYGKGIPTESLAITTRDVEVALKRGLQIVTLDGTGRQEKVLIKKVQYDHLGDRIVHVDFHKISLTEKLEVDVPVAYKGTPVGVSQEGGVLIEHVKTLKVRCLPENIPQKIEVEVGALKLHDRLRLKEVAAPPGVEFVVSLELAVASCMEPKAIEVPVAPGAEGVAAVAAAPTTTEPEVIKKGKKEEEEGAAAAGAPAKEPAAKPEKK
jgi:large subunit ribosomal protein L25